MNAVPSTTCPNCDEQITPDDRYCEACGRPLTDERPHDGRLELALIGAAGVSHRGRRHPRNEDAMQVAVLDDLVVAVVCDGVSSSSHPHVASRTAADAAVAVIAAGTDGPAARMARAVAAAQRSVERLPSGRPDLGPPACTFVGAVWDGEHVVVANVGDSRAYWIESADTDACLTEDDSAAVELARLGATTAQIEQSGNLHAIVRWLGADAPTDPYRIRTFTPTGPGQLVLCSDGLWNYAPEPAAVAALVRGHGDTSSGDRSPLAVAHALVDHALDAGGDDNVTVVVVDCTPKAPVAVATVPTPTVEELP